MDRNATPVSYRVRLGAPPGITRPGVGATGANRPYTGV